MRIAFSYLRHLLLLPAAALVLSCTPLTEAGERVRVVDDPRSVEQCKFLGDVEGTQRNHKPGESIGGNALIAETSAENEARNKAAEMGADTLLDLETTGQAWVATAKARAYRCREKG